MDNPAALYSRRNWMDKETCLGILSAVLDTMSYPNRVVNDSHHSNSIDVIDLHRLLMKGCYHHQRDREVLSPDQSKNPVGGIFKTSREIQIFVKSWSTTGRIVAINIQPTATIRQLKERIFAKEDIPPEQQRLTYAGKPLPDDDDDDDESVATITLQDYGIGQESTLQLLLRLRGGGPSSSFSVSGGECRSIHLAPDLFDERYHHDFSRVCDQGFNFYRGGVIYIRPCGWIRLALKVEGKYGDDVWLKGIHRGNHKRPDPYSSVDGEWPVSYHGTSYHNGLSIARQGFDLAKCKRSKHGHGIYSTPDIGCALKFAECATYNGRTYKLVVQNRVNPESLMKISSSQTRGGEYWISSSEKDVRPYAICIRQCLKDDFWCY